MKHIKLFEQFLNEAKYTAWIVPSDKMLAQEYRVEHELKGMNIWPSVKDFVNAVKNAKVVEIDKKMDRDISYRSGTKDFDSLHRLIKGYRSYPKYRNEETLKNLYKRFGENEPLDYPIVIKRKDGNMRIFSGNTRMDVAFQMGINPKVKMVEV